MQRWLKRIVSSVVVLAAVILGYATVYQWAMLTFEEEQVAYVQAVQVVIEALTTAGFGGHAPWESIEVNLLILAMNLSGVLLMFLALPVFGIPLMREALNSPPPTSTDLTDHVIICSHSPQDEVLRHELENSDIPYLFIDSDPEVVNELLNSGIHAIHGNPEETDALCRANAEEAIALVADINDETNPMVILSANRVNPDLRVVSVAQDRDAATYHSFSGADEVVQSRQVLGESLGLRAMKSLSEQFTDLVEVETDLEITELLVEEDSDLVGQTLGDTDVLDDHGVTVIGGWFGGKFLISPPPDTEIVENAILLVAGRHEDVDEVTARPLPSHQGHPERVVVCGYGTVGQEAVDILRSEGIEVEVVDIEEMDGVDVVGDVTDPNTLAQAGVRDARAIILALNDDVKSVYASVMLNKLVPDVEVIARTNNMENVWKLYNAGADYVLALETLTGEILASSVIDDRDILTPRQEFSFVRTDAPALVGKTFEGADIRAETGCTVVAVERDGELLTDLGPEFEILDGDQLVAAGTNEAIDEFVEMATDAKATVDG